MARDPVKETATLMLGITREVPRVEKKKTKVMTHLRKSECFPSWKDELKLDLLALHTLSMLSLEQKWSSWGKCFRRVWVTLQSCTWWGRTSAQRAERPPEPPETCYPRRGTIAGCCCSPAIKFGYIKFSLTY